MAKLEIHLPQVVLRLMMAMAHFLLESKIAGAMILLFSIVDALLLKLTPSRKKLLGEMKRLTYIHTYQAHIWPNCLASDTLPRNEAIFLSFPMARAYRKLN